MSISPIQPIHATGIESIAKPASEKPVALDNAFAEALKQASGLEKTSEVQAERFAAGDPGVGIHEVVIASEKANIALKYATTLKNKALDAYRELMSTQV